MKAYQSMFVELCLKYQALQFGQFTLKSGRISPYFFNAGLFHGGAALATLGQCYAHALLDLGFEMDMLFGPAYKGIPLVSSTAIALSHLGRDLPYSFNRKEVKDHGEGGVLVGAPLSGRVVILDDVITKGTAIRSILPLVQQGPCTVSGILLALDRQERGQGALSTVAELQQELGIPVRSILNLDDLIHYLQQNPDFAAQLVPMQNYRAQYGVQ